MKKNGLLFFSPVNDVKLTWFYENDLQEYKPKISENNHTGRYRNQH